MTKFRVLAAALTLSVLVVMTMTPVGAQTVERARSYVTQLTSATWVRAGEGSASAPSYSFVLQTNKGWYSSGTDQFDMAIGGFRVINMDGTSNRLNWYGTGGGTNVRLQMQGGTLGLAAASTVSWYSNNDILSGTADTNLTRAAAGKLTLTGTTPMIQLGGTTSSFPALKANSAVLVARLADDSGNASFTAATITGAELVSSNRVFIGATGALVSAGGNIVIAGSAPTISSGFGSSPSIVANNGTAAFTVNVGTGGTATAGVIGLPTAATGWNCYTNAPASPTMYSRQTGSTTTTATISNYNSAGTLTAWAASTVLNVSCFGY